MDPSPNPVPYGDLADARRCFGRGTEAWSSAGRLQVEDDWWIAHSGTPHVDYNLALLHGPTSVEVAPGLVDEVTRAKVPSLIILAGMGLAAAEPLRDAGWVCTGAMPFMARTGGPAVDDPAVRRIRAHELPAARALAAAAFGVPEEVGAIVYADDAVEREDCRIWGLFEDGDLKCCSHGMWVEGRYSVGWALATAPGNQRSGYGRRLLRASIHDRLHGGGPPVALLTATPVAERLYVQEGYTTLEYWQVWSRPRWVLAG
jgi:hypothetical protein